MRNEIKRDLGISDRFIDRIDYLTHFDFKSFRLQNRKKSEVDISSQNTKFLANRDCRYIGRYYEIDSATLWIGYELNNSVGKRFSFQLFLNNDKSDWKEKLINSDINFEKKICKIDGSKPWYIFYLDEALIYLQGKSEVQPTQNQEDSETSSSEDENKTMNFDDAKLEIFNTIQGVLKSLEISIELSPSS